MRSTRPGIQAGLARRASALEQVFEEASPGLWRAIYAFTAGRRSIADDAVAEAFARALERGDAIRDVVPWLYRTAFRIAATEMRRERNAVWSLPTPESDETESYGLSALLPALRQLSPAQRAAVVLHYEADLPVRDVARQMGTSPAAVKVHLFRGRQRLRELLGTQEVDGG